MPAQPLRFDESAMGSELLHVEWQTPLYEPPNMAYKPQDTAHVSIEGGVAYLGGSDGILRAVAVRNGRLLWEVDMGEPVIASPLMYKEDILIGGMSGSFYRIIKATGEVVWTYDLESSILSKAAVLGGRVFVVNNRNSLFSLDVETGKYLWHKNRPHRTEFTMNGQGAPLAANGKLYVGFSDGVMACLSPEDGASFWTRRLGKGDPRFSDVDAAPILDGERLFVSSFSGGVFALNPETGKTIWHQNMTGASTPLLKSDSLVISSADGSVVTLNKEDGAIRWSTGATQRGQLLSSPVHAGNYVVVADGNGLVAIHATSGQVIGKWTVGDGFSGKPAYTGGYLLALSNGGRLYRFRKQD